MFFFPLFFLSVRHSVPRFPFLPAPSFESHTRSSHQTPRHITPQPATDGPLVIVLYTFVPGRDGIE